MIEGNSGCRLAWWGENLLPHQIWNIHSNLPFKVWCKAQ